MAYVSSLTSGSFNWQFNEPLLTEQAIKESTCPIKTFLDEIFEGEEIHDKNMTLNFNPALKLKRIESILGKELIACESAVSSFFTILETVGGPNEKLRSEKFLPRIRVYPDLTEEQEQSLWRFTKLQVGGKIRERTFNVIAFGLYHKALTVTANKGAIEAAKMQVRTVWYWSYPAQPPRESVSEIIFFFFPIFKGINIPSIVHEARALTEQKESTAKRVDRR